jgi:hypothetical protein
MFLLSREKFCFLERFEIGNFLPSTLEIKAKKKGGVGKPGGLSNLIPEFLTEAT